MFEMGTEAWAIAIRTALVYLAVFGGLRLAGKRELGQMTIFDLVVILLIANAVQNAMTGPDFSVQGGVLAAFVLLGLNRLVSILRLRGERWERFVEGTPTVLIEDGRLIEEQLRRERLAPAEIEMVVREHGVASLDDVQLAVLETDGSISIVPRTAEVTRTHKRVRQVRRR
jgi:uncharacterized membrane protein YcaP (DUF421 family)